MYDDLKTIVKTHAFLGNKIIVDKNIGFFKCPKIDDLKENLMLYIYLINKVIDLYEDDKSEFFNAIISNEQNLQEFASIIYFFFEVEQIKFSDYKFILNDQNFIDKDNICVFIESLRALHHFDKKDDDYVPANKVAAEMMKRARKLKKEMESKVRQKDGVGFLEIMSTVCARHSSLNPATIGQLNYYQILDQYKRLLMIDMYTPCLYGNATEEYIKKNNVKHYSLKLINE